VRSEASILHLDLDAFFAAVEQRDKPSLRGKPVVVGGVGLRGVVATASYEARAFGVRSAMSTAEARSRCPNAAFLTGRFHAYRTASAQVMAALEELSPLVEPLSLDEAFVDLRAGSTGDFSTEGLRSIGELLREHVREATGGLTASVGIASSKLVAKIATEIDKPDGLVVVEPGTEFDLLSPMSVRVIPGIGPATYERLRRIGVNTVGELAEISPEELIRQFGQAHGAGLHELAHARDDRPVVAERETKSVSVEDTYESDLTDPAVIEGHIARHAARVAKRLQASRLSGRTVTVKLRRYDFTTHTRSSTLPEPTDSIATITRLARQLLAEMDATGGVRLLGVGVSGLADWIQDELFGADDEVDTDEVEPAEAPVSRRWTPGMDIVHTTQGQGWVWGSGRGRVTVRFETAETGPGPVRTYSVDDPELERWTPPPAN
jgi:DNA polymerase-4